MTKTITREEFLLMAFPIKGIGKELIEPKMQLIPINKGVINGNTYSIIVDSEKDEVILTKIGSK